MVTISKPLSVVLAAAVALGTAAIGVHASDSFPTQVFKPGRGVSLDAGTKKVVAYYLAGDHVCDLTLMIGDLPDADGHVSGSATRISVPVKAGSQSRVYTSEGHALEASCGLSAKIMTLRPLALTAEVVK